MYIFESIFYLEIQIYSWVCSILGGIPYLVGSTLEKNIIENPVHIHVLDEVPLLHFDLSFPLSSINTHKL